MAIPEQPNSPPARVTAPQKARKLAISPAVLMGLLAAAFLLGLVPMWLSSVNRGRELTSLTERHDAAALELALTRAAVLARQGEYEAARGAASEFFTALNSRLIAAGDNADASDGALRATLTERDEIITLLARSDPASADKLAALYMNFRNSRAGDRAER